ncbi:MAG TPA: class I SAM-dependent methyltransferase [Anaerolineae bacterium]|nr:class I SAM-dependent methyltransferase [Anaerolineae bacterium]
MDHFITIYTSRARDYHHLILPEDTDQNLLPAIEHITPVHGQRILDLGSGTGRLPLLFGDRPAQLICLDLHAAMLAENAHQRRHHRGRWSLVQGDMSRLPLPDGWAEVVTAGWALGHFTGWYVDWQAKMQRVLAEMHRLVAPGGALLIMETLTTGSLTPAPPTEALGQYYAWLESDWGFSRQEIRTDYQFASVKEAVAKTEFFFGPELVEKIRRNGWARLPEWTGVWGKKL